MHACVQALLFFISEVISGYIFWKKKRKKKNFTSSSLSFFFVTKFSFCKSPHYLVFPENVSVNFEIFLGYLWFPQLLFSTGLLGYFFQLLSFTLSNIVSISRLLYELIRNICSSICCDDELQCRLMKEIKCFQTLSKLIFWFKWMIIIVSHMKICPTEGHWGKPTKFVLN